jgi:hypothetical protein
MLRRRMKAFGIFAVTSFVVTWGAFTAVTLPEGTIPRELLWLSAVVATGATLAIFAFALLRSRRRNKGL